MLENLALLEVESRRLVAERKRVKKLIAKWKDDFTASHGRGPNEEEISSSQAFPLYQEHRNVNIYTSQFQMSLCNVIKLPSEYFCCTDKREKGFC